MFQEPCVLVRSLEDILSCQYSALIVLYFQRLLLAFSIILGSSRAFTYQHRSILSIHLGGAITALSVLGLSHDHRMLVSRKSFQGSE